MALDERKGVWKSGKGKGRHTPKGRQYEDQALQEVQVLLGPQPRERDLLIEFLHLIQDEYGHLSAAHLRALRRLFQTALKASPLVLVHMSPIPMSGALAKF